MKSEHSAWRIVQEVVVRFGTKLAAFTFLFWSERKLSASMVNEFGFAA
jgi:hypothetical protein